MRKFRMFPVISSPTYPVGTPLPKAVIIDAADAESAVRIMERRHKQGHLYTTVSAWSAVEERA